MSGKGEQRRAQLLDAAEELLVTVGGAELSMRSVAAAAGVRLGHLQYYFPTHADLVGAVLERVLSRSAERMEPLLARSADDGELVGALLAEQQDARLVRLFTELWALAARDEAMAAAVRGFYATYRDHVADFLACRRPLLSEEVRRARAQVFVMLVEGAALFRSGVAGEREPAVDEELVRTARALLAP
ncbi:TetR/AcrR family transcriptional regulator [Streptomyces sp. FH025]|uniref:TetR/AcrR family transcriptional regulator n=1 Tax=Streptomyces sp. FH025 TaxID=2815937 RepID=UPI001A9D5B7C|nr:TetR family transcriptional regulator [Streptomyces sp. FH025]MBO1418311.1 TetR family transcriptional regulator [Streptomyces sp. FH025]